MRYGHATPKQMVISPRRPKGGKCCEKCRELVFTPDSACRKGFALDADKCGQFDDVSVDRSLND